MMPPPPPSIPIMSKSLYINLHQDFSSSMSKTSCMCLLSSLSSLFYYECYIILLLQCNLFCYLFLAHTYPFCQCRLQYDEAKLSNHNTTTVTVAACSFCGFFCEIKMYSLYYNSCNLNTFNIQLSALNLFGQSDSSSALPSMTG